MHLLHAEPAVVGVLVLVLVLVLALAVAVLILRLPSPRSAPSTPLVLLCATF
jgi:hypothetical protein